MIKFFAKFKILPTAFVVISCLNLVAQDKKRIGVVVFEEASKTKNINTSNTVLMRWYKMASQQSQTSQSSANDLGDAMAKLLIAELMQNRNYELIDRSELELRAREKKLGTSGLTQDAAQIGRELALDYIVTGTVLEASTKQDVNSSNPGIIPIPFVGEVRKSGKVTTLTEMKIILNIQITEVESGRIVFSDSEEASATNRKTKKTNLYNHNLEKLNSSQGNNTLDYTSYLNLAKEAIEKLARKIMVEIAPIEATVLLVKENDITIDIGRKDGVRIGQTFKVTKKGEPLYHPRTGELVGLEIIEIAEIAIERVEATTSVGKIVKRLQDAKSPDYQISRGDDVKINSQ